MLDECLNYFKEELDNKKTLILDEIIPADGDYVLVREDGTYQVVKIKYSKKEKTLIEKPSNDILKQIRFYDYHSQLVSMNKPQDPVKTIHSNNYLSFFVKKENFKNGKMNDEAINRYFQSLENPHEKYKGKDLKMYNFIANRLNDLDIDKLNKCKKWVKENIFNLNEVDYDNKDYLKIFFEANEATYINENNRYTLAKLFNCNNYNSYKNATVYGLPNYNMQFNGKKPFLENKSRMQTVPYLVSLEQAIIQKNFFDYLMNQANKGRTNIYIDTSENVDKRFVALDNQDSINGFDGIFLKIKKGKELEIQYMDTITDYKTYLEPIFEFDNLIKAEYDECYHEYKEKYEVENLINEILFSKYLKNNYFTTIDDLKGIDSVYRKNIIRARDAVFQWRYLGRIENIGTILKDVAMDFIKCSIQKGYIKKARKQLNLYFALNKYFNGEENNMENIRDSLRNKINADNQEIIENDEEYSYAVGQAISYLQDRSRAKNNMQDMINQFLVIQNDKVLKNKLRKLYTRYSYSLQKGKNRHSFLLAMIMEYTVTKKINHDLVMAGYLGENLIYEKRGQESE